MSWTRVAIVPVSVAAPRRRATTDICAVMPRADGVALRQRQVDVRLGHAVDQAARADVAGDAGDRRDELQRAFRVARDDREPHRLSDRRLAGPQLPRQRFADHDDQRAGRRVGRLEVPPGDDGNAERREVAGVDDVPGRREHRRRPGRSPGADLAEADAFEAAGRNPRERRALDGRRLPDALEHGPPQVRPVPDSGCPATAESMRGDVDAARHRSRDRRRRRGAARARRTRRARRAARCTRSGRRRTRCAGASVRRTTARRP